MLNTNKKSTPDNEIRINPRKPDQSYANDMNANIGVPNIANVITAAPITSNVSFILPLLKMYRIRMPLLLQQKIHRDNQLLHHQSAIPSKP